LGGETLFPLERSEIAIAVGRAVRRLRQSRDFSQETLAVRAGVNLKHLSEIERGKHDLRIDTVHKLARGLDLSYGALAAAADEELVALEARAPRDD
jgi:transcriptional regulator with XRE-family HTH domain